MEGQTRIAMRTQTSFRLLKIGILTRGQPIWETHKVQIIRTHPAHCRTKVIKGQMPMLTPRTCLQDRKFITCKQLLKMVLEEWASLNAAIEHQGPNRQYAVLQTPPRESTLRYVR